jgi:hypothetical protein
MIWKPLSHLTLATENNKTNSVTEFQEGTFVLARESVKNKIYGMKVDKSVCSTSYSERFPPRISVGEILKPSIQANNKSNNYLASTVLSPLLSSVWHSSSVRYVKVYLVLCVLIYPSWFGSADISFSTL